MRVKRDDRGVTLPEVLVAITILAIIIVPLADALIGFVRNTDATTRRMNESHDIQLASAYFSRDIQNLGVRNWSSPTLDLAQSIGDAFQCPGSGTAVFSLAYDDPAALAGLPTVIRITYLVRDVNGEHQLRRVQCRGTSTVDNDIAVVHNLFGIPAKPTCDPDPCTGAGSGVPRRVTLNLSVKDPASPTETQVVLTGYRGQT